MTPTHLGVQGQQGKTVVGERGLSATNPGSRGIVLGCGGDGTVSVKSGGSGDTVPQSCSGPVLCGAHKQLYFASSRAV